ncbi:hypothetical protein BaRGS_00014186 [Batillaria attramentaria]|uniref:Uncharacterized protein n=1 Tax=Batillaria attramentaria TaxID=370345 RepID=A0ABD0L5I4_9CAEN
MRAEGTLGDRVTDMSCPCLCNQQGMGTPIVQRPLTHVPPEWQTSRYGFQTGLDTTASFSSRHVGQQKPLSVSLGCNDTFEQWP